MKWNVKSVFNGIFRIVTSRLALNALVWLFMLDMVYNNNISGKAPVHDPVYVFHVVLMQLIWAALIYINTLILIPQFLLKKKYGWYTLAALLHALLFTWIIGGYSEWLLKAYPGTEKHFYSSINIPDRADLKEAWDYYLNVFLGSVVITLILFSLGCLMQHFFKERRRNELLQKKQTESELMLLRSQVNPHFLFNVLNSIYSLSLKKSDAAPGVILKLSDILRYMLYESRQDFVPLEKELQMLRDYIDIEKIRLTDKNAISLDITPEKHNGYIAPALLISFVENAIKHGLDSRTADAFVTIRITADEHNQSLHFYCRNNYLPRNGKAVHTNRVGGIGLENVNKRLDLIYPGKHNLKIVDENNIFEVNLTIKLNQYDLPHN